MAFQSEGSSSIALISQIELEAKKLGVQVAEVKASADTVSSICSSIITAAPMASQSEGASSIDLVSQIELEAKKLEKQVAEAKATADAICANHGGDRWLSKLSDQQIPEQVIASIQELNDLLHKLIEKQKQLIELKRLQNKQGAQNLLNQ